jgi:hypothetical protein
MAAARHQADLPAPLLDAIMQAISARGWTGRLVGAEAAFRCPEHDDATPSAHWNTQKHTWYCQVCQVGGGALDLARRLGVPLPEPRLSVVGDHRPPAVVATFTYRDATGRAVYHIDRIEPGRDGRRKDFLPRATHVQPGDWRRYGLKKHGIDAILYRLDDLPAAGSGATVFIAEGERKVDLLRSWGLVATCNAGGAKKWQPDYSQRLAGLTIVLLPDNDSAGVEHIDRIAADLQRVAATVRVLRLPGLATKGDIIDWVASGGDRDQFLALVAEAPPWTAQPDPAVVDRLERQLADAEATIQRLRAEVEHGKALQRALFDLHANPVIGKHGSVIANVLREVISRRDQVDDWVGINLTVWQRVDQTTGEVTLVPSRVAGGWSRQTTANIIKAFAETRPDVLAYRNVAGRAGVLVLECRCPITTLVDAIVLAAATERALERADAPSTPKKYLPNRRCGQCDSQRVWLRRTVVRHHVCDDCGAEVEVGPAGTPAAARSESQPRMSKFSRLVVNQTESPVYVNRKRENFDMDARAHAREGDEPGDRVAALRGLRPVAHHIQPLDACAVTGCDTPATHQGGDGLVRCRAHALIAPGGLSVPLESLGVTP